VRRIILIHVLMLVAMPGCVGGSGPPFANLVILNAHVWTGHGTEAEAVAIRGQRILAVGSNAQVANRIDGDTGVIDAQGRRVIPGITDCHVHIVSGGEQLSRLYLRDVHSKREFVDAVAKTAGDTAEGEWILGGRWSVESWSHPESPMKAWVDGVAAGKPLFLTRMDGHQALANSAALRLAGIDRNGPADPPGGVIERDSVTHEPTGILKDSAMDLVSRHVPVVSVDDMYVALLRAMKHANALGITGVHDMSGPDDLAAMTRAHREGTLTLRIRKYLFVDDWTKAVDSVKSFDVHDAFLTVAGFKGYMDGSMGSRTAYMYRPYADASPKADYPSGILSAQAIPPKSLRYMIEVADGAQLQCAVHAIGDEANHLLLDMYASVARKNGRRDSRHRIEHAQHLLPEDIGRFAELGVVASMQPLHKADDGRYAEKAIGEDRLDGAYAFRALIESGALVCFGSDWPVVSLNPFEGIAAAVTAKTLDGATWLPEGSITVPQAVYAYTVAAAKVGFSERDLGTLELGKLADMVILDRDIFTIDADQIGDTKPVATIVGGEIVYDSGELRTARARATDTRVRSDQ